MAGSSGAANLRMVISAQTTDAERRLARLTAGIQDVDEAAEEASSGGLASLMASVAGGFAGGLASGAIGALTSGISSLISEVITANAESQKTEIAYKNLFRSAEKGTKFLRDLTDFAGSSGLDNSALEATSQEMLTIYKDGNKVLALLRDMGNVSESFNKGTAGIDKLASLFTGIRRDGAAGTSEIQALTEFGIDGFDALAKSTGKSRRQIVALAKQGRISADMFEKAFSMVANDDFGRGLADQSSTALGSISRIQAAVKKFTARTTKPFFDFATNGLDLIADFAQSPVAEAVANHLEGIAKAISLMAGGGLKSSLEWISSPAGAKAMRELKDDFSEGFKAMIDLMQDPEFQQGSRELLRFMVRDLPAATVPMIRFGIAAYKVGKYTMMLLSPFAIMGKSANDVRKLSGTLGPFVNRWARVDKLTSKSLPVFRGLRDATKGVATYVKQAASGALNLAKFLAGNVFTFVSKKIGDGWNLLEDGDKSPLEKLIETAGRLSPFAFIFTLNDVGKWLQDGGAKRAAEGLHGYLSSNSFPFSGTYNTVMGWLVGGGTTFISKADEFKKWLSENPFSFAGVYNTAVSWLMGSGTTFLSKAGEVKNWLENNPFSFAGVYNTAISWLMGSGTTFFSKGIEFKDWLQNNAFPFSGAYNTTISWLMGTGTTFLSKAEELHSYLSSTDFPFSGIYNTAIGWLMDPSDGFGAKANELHNYLSSKQFPFSGTYNTAFNWLMDPAGGFEAAANSLHNYLSSTSFPFSAQYNAVFGWLIGENGLLAKAQQLWQWLTQHIFNFQFGINGPSTSSGGTGAGASAGYPSGYGSLSGSYSSDRGSASAGVTVQNTVQVMGPVYGVDDLNDKVARAMFETQQRGRVSGLVPQV